MRQVVELIATGRLAGGDRLPSHRELSEQLVIAPLTVKKAYDELEAEGYIETQRGRGTFVRDRPPDEARAANAAALAAAAHALVSRAYAAGLGFDDVVALLQDANDRLLPPTADADRNEHMT